MQTSDESQRQQRLSGVRRLVVKIGSSSLTGADRQLHRPTIRRLVHDLVELREQGLEIILVSSGAVAAGMGRLGMTQRPRSIADLQAVAAVGQNLLVHTYESLFRRHDVPVGQVLLTAGDILDDRQRYNHVRNTFRQLFELGVVPVINENDSVAVAELRATLGDNDMLAAYVANLVQAQLLVILSDVDGVYRRYVQDKGEDLLVEVEPDQELRLQGGGNRLGRGGIETKLRAAHLLSACGEMTIVAHARKHRLPDLLTGNHLGTLFLPRSKRMGSRKRWIGFASPARGTIVVDEGAVKAIVRLGRSLLPAGVTDCEGTFRVGDVIRVVDGQGREIGRGLSRYGSDDLDRIRGLRSSAVEKALGHKAQEVIHRDDLVLT
ncbi:MAG: glutamate 5-kinase [Gemmatimonadaceae bacterium]|nr:glutamate 5-kinase [Gemmatimonadaceae bacterium]